MNKFFNLLGFADIDLTGAMDPIMSILNPILIALLSLLIVAAAVSAVIIGFQMHFAENSEKRANLKKRLIWVLLGLLIPAALIGIAFGFRETLIEWILEQMG